ncbi:MAG TPA: hypothetical protein VJ935_10020 [Acidimicrobiia bacterium]|nr:hypothetical protein [Acidimicrobiia bacterium]
MITIPIRTNSDALSEMPRAPSQSSGEVGSLELREGKELPGVAVLARWVHA